jgi:hypothetical protein
MGKLRMAGRPLLRGAQLAPASSLLKTLPSVAAYTVLEDVGSTARSRTFRSVSPVFEAAQVVPPSSLLKTPSKVPT